MRILKKGQVSLEFIFVLLGFLAVFSAIIPFSSRAFHTAVFALECGNAKSFSDSIESAVFQLKSLGSNSAIMVSANPFLDWKISSNGNELLVSVESKELLMEKSFSIFFPNEVLMDLHFDSKKDFLIKKENGKIFPVLLENSD